MIKHCIETSFETFLDVDYLVKTGDNKSTNSFYGSWIEAGKEKMSIFNHHDMTNAETYDAFQRRCERFMTEYNEGGLGLLYTTYDAEADVEGLLRFADFVAKTSPGSKVIGMWLKQTGKSDCVCELKSEHLDIYTLCYGDYDNLEDVKKVCTSYMV